MEQKAKVITIANTMTAVKRDDDASAFFFAPEIRLLKVRPKKFIYL